MSDIVPDPAGNEERQRTLLIEISGKMTRAVLEGLLEVIRSEARRVGAAATVIWPAKRAAKKAAKKAKKR